MARQSKLATSSLKPNQTKTVCGPVKPPFIMKNTLNTYDIATALRNDENANWSRSGAFALAEHLEDLEDQLGIEMELDIVSFRFGYSEYGSALEWAEEYFGVDALVDMIPDEVDSNEEEAWCKEYICDRGELIEFDGGVIVSTF